MTGVFVFILSLLVMGGFIFWGAYLNFALYRKVIKIESDEKQVLVYTTGGNVYKCGAVKYAVPKSWRNMKNGKSITFDDRLDNILFLHREGVEVAGKRFWI